MGLNGQSQDPAARRINQSFPFYVATSTSAKAGSLVDYGRAPAASASLQV